MDKCKRIKLNSNIVSKTNFNIQTNNYDESYSNKDIKKLKELVNELNKRDDIEFAEIYLRCINHWVDVIDDLPQELKNPCLVHGDIHGKNIRVKIFTL